MSNIKLSKEDIEQLTKLQNEENRLIVNFGRLEISQIDLDQEKENLEEDLNKHRKNQIELGAKLQEKYGEGRINLETGELIKSE
tara:strand:- start:24 stop:275 length:252 start_codon:yes stop_codon:yes gene_type:complete